MCLLDSWFSLSYFYSSGPACYLNEQGEAGWGSRAGGVGGGGGWCGERSGAPRFQMSFWPNFPFCR